jgi:hypothetical protein
MEACQSSEFGQSYLLSFIFPLFNLIFNFDSTFIAICSHFSILKKIHGKLIKFLSSMIIPHHRLRVLVTAHYLHL